MKNFCCHFVRESKKSFWLSRNKNHHLKELNKKFNLTVQNQVDKELVWTGQYFQILLNPNTFYDEYTEVENLNYQVFLAKDNNETAALPNWLTFYDLTLMGTAPEEIWNRDFYLRLVVKNEFQELKIPLKLHLKISSSFVLKLFVKYSPYILSIVGLLISANKISNVLFKSTYKHPKDFQVRVGEEITSEVIFPVAFIREEIQESKKILRLLGKKAGAKNKMEFLSYFMLQEGERRIDKMKVLENISESLNALTSKERKDFRLYLRGRGEGSHPRGLVNQIIVNTLTNDLIKSNEEKETRSCFEKIKKRWPEFVEWDLNNSCFKINNDKFHRLIGMKDLEESTTTLTNDDIENRFLSKGNVNIELLKDALLAHAFECQNIDILPVFIQVQVKERIKTDSLKRFLKLDLKDSPLREKGRIGYGIGYTKEFNTLCFNGVVKPDMMEKTLVIQITNLNHKILKELWIFENYENEEGVFDVQSEGSGYGVL